MTKKISIVNTIINPFDVEKEREKYALKKDNKNFIDLYSKNIPEIINKNTRIFWDSILDRKSKNQDSMTKDRINKTIKLIKGKEITILDVGIGDAWVEQKLEDSGIQIRITGLDIAQDNLKKLKKHFNQFTPIQSSLENISKQKFTEKFDYVLALEVFEHISPKKILTIQKTLKNLLKKNGKLIVSVPINEDLQEKIKNRKNYSHHVRRYTEPIIRYELETSGYKIEKIRRLYAFSKHYFAKTLISKIFGIRQSNVIILKCSK